MKKLINKIKKSCHNFVTGKSGFSLVELIVVIAIMAVMAAVLAPALLGHVERSRAQKDISALDEVVNSVQLALADQEIYDEVLEHSVWDNVSCYIDKKSETEFADYKISLKAANAAAGHAEQYMFSDEARQLDETVYYAAGNMRGLTITFSPLDSTETYDFANGILNKFVGRNTGILSENPELYNNLRSVIGDKLKTTSQTYRNSDYTIFIRVGSTGGSEAVMQDAIQVWGQFNGTNLAEKDHKYELSSGRVVGAAGTNDATNNQTNNENGNVDFSENPVVIKTMMIDLVEYQYEDGMTWEQWVDSIYNTCGMEYLPGWIWKPSNSVGSQFLKVNAPVLNTSNGHVKLSSKSDVTEDMLTSLYDVGVMRDNLIYPISYWFGTLGAEVSSPPTLSEIRNNYEFVWCEEHGPIF